jgi:hypothetical protein
MEDPPVAMTTLCGRELEAIWYCTLPVEMAETARNGEEREKSLTQGLSRGN